MLSFFPKPYPDELLYSLIARYHTQSGNLCMGDTMCDLFGRQCRSISIVLPVRLGVLAENVQLFHVDFDQLLYQSTMFPFFMSMKSEEKYWKIYRWAKESESRAASYELGVVNYLPRKRYLCFCPMCFEEEQEKYGESYWHRLHQTPGILICEKHYCRLQSSNVSALSDDIKGYYPLTKKQVSLTEHLPNLVGREEILAKQMGQDIMYLYNCFERVHFQFVKNECTFRTQYLSILMEKGYSTRRCLVRKHEFADDFEQYFTRDYLDKIGVPIFGKYKQWNIKICRSGGKIKDPLKYILMAQFLCGSFEEFMERVENNADELVVKTQMKKPVKDFDIKRVQYRKRFQSLCNQHENASKTIIRNMDRATWLWLSRHDKEWLESHFGKNEKRGGSNTFSLWNRRDEQWSKQIKSVAQKIKKRNGKPVQVTVRKIASELHLGDVFYKYKEYLPLTMMALTLACESKHEWYIRKIKWAENELLKEEGKIIKWRVLRKAGIGNNCEEYYKYYNSSEENEIESSEKNGWSEL